MRPTGTPKSTYAGPKANDYWLDPTGPLPTSLAEATIMLQSETKSEIIAALHFTKTLFESLSPEESTIIADWVFPNRYHEGLLTTIKHADVEIASRALDAVAHCYMMVQHNPKYYTTWMSAICHKDTIAAFFNFHPKNTPSTIWTMCRSLLSLFMHQYFGNEIKRTDSLVQCGLFPHIARTISTLFERPDCTYTRPGAQGKPVSHFLTVFFAILEAFCYHLGLYHPHGAPAVYPNAKPRKHAALVFSESFCLIPEMYKIILEFPELDSRPLLFYHLLIRYAQHFHPAHLKDKALQDLADAFSQLDGFAEHLTKKEDSAVFHEFLLFLSLHGRLDTFMANAETFPLRIGWMCKEHLRVFPPKEQKRIMSLSSPGTHFSFHTISPFALTLILFFRHASATQLMDNSQMFEFAKDYLDFWFLEDENDPTPHKRFLPTSLCGPSLLITTMYECLSAAPRSGLSEPGKLTCFWLQRLCETGILDLMVLIAGTTLYVGPEKEVSFFKNLGRSAVLLIGAFVEKALPSANFERFLRFSRFSSVFGQIDPTTQFQQDKEKFLKKQIHAKTQARIDQSNQDFGELLQVYTDPLEAEQKEVEHLNSLQFPNWHNQDFHKEADDFQLDDRINNRQDDEDDEEYEDWDEIFKKDENDENEENDENDEIEETDAEKDKNHQDDQNFKEFQNSTTLKKKLLPSLAKSFQLAPLSVQATLLNMATIVVLFKHESLLNTLLGTPFQTTSLVLLLQIVPNLLQIGPNMPKCGVKSEAKAEADAETETEALLGLLTLQARDIVSGKVPRPILCNCAGVFENEERKARAAKSKSLKKANLLGTLDKLAFPGLIRVIQSRAEHRAQLDDKFMVEAEALEEKKRQIKDKKMKQKLKQKQKHKQKQKKNKKQNVENLQNVENVDNEESDEEDEENEEDFDHCQGHACISTHRIDIDVSNFSSSWTPDPSVVSFFTPEPMTQDEIRAGRLKRGWETARENDDENGDDENGDDENGNETGDETSDEMATVGGLRGECAVLEMETEMEMDVEAGDVPGVSKDRSLAKDAVFWAPESYFGAISGLVQVNAVETQGLATAEEEAAAEEATAAALKTTTIPSTSITPTSLSPTIAPKSTATVSVPKTQQTPGPASPVEPTEQPQPQPRLTRLQQRIRAHRAQSEAEARKFDSRYD